LEKGRVGVGIIMSESRKLAIPTVQLENDRVIVTEWKFSPGAETTWHRHEYDYVVVPQTKGKLNIETETEEFEAELVSGVSYSRTKGVKHNVVNQNDHEFVFVEIELK
jgi:quercetin dioxygenase-like cupin family protein